MKNKESNAEALFTVCSFPAYLPAWKDSRLLDEHEYFEQSMGELLVELADEIPPVVVDPRRPQAIFNAGELLWFGHVWCPVPNEAIDQFKESMKKAGAGNNQTFMFQSESKKDRLSLICLLGPFWVYG